MSEFEYYANEFLDSELDAIADNGDLLCEKYCCFPFTETELYEALIIQWSK